MKRSPPAIWSIAGTDSGGGAGLSADQRAADAFGVHLCPVVAAITAQNTTAVTQVQAVDAAMLDAQLAALAGDMPPRAIKTGLLGNADNLRVVARWVDRLRNEGHELALVVDPVLRASTGATLASETLITAYRELLLPRTTLITPNEREAMALLACDEGTAIQMQAAKLQGLGAQAVVITGGDGSHPSLSLDWMLTPHAQGWLSLPRLPTPHTHGTGCTFASSAAAAMSMGFVTADAVVLAKMATTHAIREARQIGQGAGPVAAGTGFSVDPKLLPQLSLDDQPPTHWQVSNGRRSPGVYAIVDSAERVEAVLACQPTVQTIQLRMKRPPWMEDSAWNKALVAALQRSQAAADKAGVQLVINDHWRAAIDAGARALHLGQEDLLALTPQDRQLLANARAQGVQLGLSSHSLWELCRAAGLQPDLIACGPIWPTTTKDMPWKAQGLDNLAWWAHMAPAPVVGIGGILVPEQLRDVASAGAEGGCVVRGIGDAPSRTLPGWLHAWSEGIKRLKGGSSNPFPALPHPSL